jgi:hypothetical protein
MIPFPTSHDAYQWSSSDPADSVYVANHTVHTFSIYQTPNKSYNEDTNKHRHATREAYGQTLAPDQLVAGSVLFF